MASLSSQKAAALEPQKECALPTPEQHPPPPLLLLGVFLEQANPPKPR
jgi:hypothetical protein